MTWLRDRFSQLRETLKNETTTTARSSRRHTRGGFDNAVGKLLSVPKEALLKEEARLKRGRRKRAKKPMKSI